MIAFLASFVRIAKFSPVTKYFGKQKALSPVRPPLLESAYEVFTPLYYQQIKVFFLNVTPLLDQLDDLSSLKTLK